MGGERDFGGLSEDSVLYQVGGDIISKSKIIIIK